MDQEKFEGGVAVVCVTETADSCYPQLLLVKDVGADSAGFVLSFATYFKQ